eukprot:m.2430 g.2430  ORF g.2430 m.2430 type:complete len:559 (-) comp1785_c0_seq1:474-2150(-)
MLKHVRPVNVRVTTMDAELEFAIHPNTTGQQLYEQVVKTIGLRELWYFGLKYVDNKGLSSWLQMKKKVMHQDVKKESPLQFKFRAKFHPEDVGEELIQDVTIRLFYLQVRESILSEDCYCPPETSLLLASYAVQAKYGDYNPHVHNPGFLRHEKLLPPRVLEQHRFSREEWEDRTVEWYKEHRGLLREDAMLEYLKIAQDLEMYGVNYFEIKNKKGTQLWLGVDALGLNVYSFEDRLSPKIGFPWSEIRNISFSNKKFIIRPIEKHSPDFSFFSSRLRINKRILSLCIGNHELYQRRRRPDTIDVKQMKAEAQEVRAARQAERLRLLREVQARMLAERKRAELEKRLKEYETQAANAMQALAKSETVAKELEEKVARVEAEAAAREQLRLEAERLKREAELQVQGMQPEDAEKERILQEAKELADALSSQADREDFEVRKLQQQLQEAKKKQVEDAKALMSATSPANFSLNVNESSIDEEPHKNFEINHDSISSSNEKIRRMLESLGQELDTARNPENESKLDALYKSNLVSGKDKFKTLQRIRAGNTRQRIMDFENM